MSSPPSSFWARTSEKAVALLWCSAALGAAIFGNGEHDLFTLLLNSTFIHRPFLVLGLASLAVNVALFLYAFLWLQKWCNFKEPLRKKPWLEVGGAVTLGVAFFSLLFSIWPIFGFLSPLLLVVLLYGAVMSLNFLPTGGLLNPRKVGHLKAL